MGGGDCKHCYIGHTDSTFRTHYAENIKGLNKIYIVNKYAQHLEHGVHSPCLLGDLEVLHTSRKDKNLLRKRVLIVCTDWVLPILQSTSLPAEGSTTTEGYDSVH